MQNTERYNVNVGIEDLIINVVKLLYDYLLGQKLTKTQQRFEGLKKGEIQSVAYTPRDDGKHIDILLSLDKSEFVGILDFEVFRQFIAHLLDSLSNTQASNQALPVREEATGRRFVISIPAALEIQQQLNVLMLGFNQKKKIKFILNYCFSNPLNLVNPLNR